MEIYKGKNENKLKLSFCEIENILQFLIDHSFLNYKKELSQYEYNVLNISMKEKVIYFVKVNKD